MTENPPPPLTTPAVREIRVVEASSQACGPPPGTCEVSAAHVSRIPPLAPRRLWCARGAATMSRPSAPGHPLQVPGGNVPCPRFRVSGDDHEVGVCG